ncbi:MAG: transcription elongation factor GreA [Thermoguttaceae bacterium]
MSNTIPMTREGYSRLRAEIERMEMVEMPIIVERLATARAEGDLKENAEYHGARESQGLLQAKINDLKAKIGRAEIVDTSAIPQGEIRFGATIKVKRLSTGEEEIYTLVGAGDEDFDTGKILVTSPFAQGFLGKKKGQKAEVTVPAGKFEFDILDVSYDG